jgi:ribose transport system substrate-binding protein
MRCALVTAVLAAALSLPPMTAPWAQAGMAERVNQGTVGVIAGSIDGTSMRAASDLAAVLDDGDRLRILPIQGKGSVQAITDLLYLRGIDVGLIQRDALEYSRREGIHANLDQRLKYIAKLFNEEIHVVARREFATIAALRGQPVNIGVPGSGSDLTATLLLDALKVEVQPQQLDHAMALQKLKAGELAAMVYVGGKPMPLLEHLGEADGLHLLPIDYTPELLDLYLPARFDSADYPGLVAAGGRVDTLAVEAVMAVYNWPADTERHRKVARFAEAFFGKLGQLQEPPRHRKWQDVGLAAELPGWQRFGPAEAILRRSVVAEASPARASFERFLAARDLAGVPAAVKDSLFAEFVAWQNSQELTFALVPKAVNNAFFTVAHDGCKQAENELPGVRCLYIGPGEHTEQEQAQILQDLIDHGISGIAVSPTNSPLMAGVLRRAQEAKIPVITFDSDLAPEDRPLRQTYLGSNNYEMGVQVARTAQQQKPGGGELCILTGAANAANHMQRVQGIRDTLAGRRSSDPYGDRLIGQNGWTEAEDCPLVHNNDVETAVAQLKDVLARRPGLDVIVSTAATTQRADEAYRAAIAPYRDRLRRKDLVMVMADTLPMQMAQLRDGLSTAQIGQRPFEMGYRAIYVLRDLAQGKQVLADPIHTALDVCLQTTVESCIARISAGGELARTAAQ